METFSQSKSSAQPQMTLGFAVTQGWDFGNTGITGITPGGKDGEKEGCFKFQPAVSHFISPDPVWPFYCYISLTVYFPHNTKTKSITFVSKPFMCLGAQEQPCF